MVIGVFIMKTITVNNREFKIIKLLGKGNGWYSYSVDNDNKTIYELALEDKVKSTYINQLKEMCDILYPLNINIDYFPTNFIVQDEQIWYIDYECNNYMEEWNLKIEE